MKEKMQNHILVPKHEKISEKDKKELLEKYGSTEKFPAISIKDAAIINLNVKPGDIIKITRQEPTTLNSVYYRVVMNDKN